MEKVLTVSHKYERERSFSNSHDILSHQKKKRSCLAGSPQDVRRKQILYSQLKHKTVCVRNARVALFKATLKRRQSR